MYGNFHGREGQLRVGRTSMQPPTAPSDLRMGIHAGMSGSPGAGLMVSHTSDGSPNPQVVGLQGSEDYRWGLLPCDPERKHHEIWPTV